MSYEAPTAEIAFLLRRLTPIASLCALPAYAHADADMIHAVVEEAAKVARDIVAPLNAVADNEGARLENGRVATPTGFRAAYDQLAADGWTSLAVPQAHGGQALPQLANTIVAEMFGGACVAFQMALLTGSPAAKVIMAHGTQAQKDLWLPQLADGSSTATIVITEPQAGSDVGLVRTRAQRRDDGTYGITGAKIFISQGDHDLTEQILHVVIARTPDGAPGTRGLSLFLVPKRIPDGAGKPGAMNGVRAARLEHKMGLRGSPTCEMLFEDATGYLVGKEGEGLRNLFAMMNAMRLDVGAQCVGVASAALRKALLYVHERRQGGAGADGKPVPIVQHPDVRRLLLSMRAWTDGMRALLYTAAWHEDMAQCVADPQAAARSAALVGWLLPLVKAGASEVAFNVASQAIQLHGGHGYVSDHGVEQYARDARVFAIYEGANAIQANDLVMRKLARGEGETFRHFASLIRADMAAAEGDGRLADVTAALGASLEALERASAYMLARLGSADAHAGAPIYMQLAINVAVGWMWLKMASAERGTPEADLRALHARFFAAHVLVDSEALAGRAMLGAAMLEEAGPEQLTAW